MAKHKAHVPWRGLRRRFQDLTVEHQRLQRAFRTLEEQWSEAFQEAVRLKETYEPTPGTSWGRTDVDAYMRGIRDPERLKQELIEELTDWDPDRTEEISVSAIRVGIDPSGTGPSGIAVIKVSEDGTAEVIHDESR